MLRVKKIADSKGLTLAQVAERMGVQYNTLGKFLREDSPSFPTLKKLSEALECEIQELLDTSDQYAHFYDPKTGEWLGIRKK